MYILASLLLAILFALVVVIGMMVCEHNISMPNRLIRLTIAVTLAYCNYMIFTSDYMTTNRAKNIALREQADKEDNLSAETNHPPKLVTTVKGCEIWEFYMDGRYNHYLAKCPDSVTITYPVGKASSETISTETH